MQLTLQSPYDMHLHLRDTPMLEAVAKYTARYFSGALVMPNLNPPVDCLDLALAYKERILKACGDSTFTPLMSLYLTEKLDRAQLKEVLQNPNTLPQDFPKIVNIITIDGVRVVFEEGWGLVRASNTTPVLVTRFEAKSAESCARYQKALLELLEQIKTKGL